MLENSLARKIVEALRNRLAAVDRAPMPDTPLGDVRWLRDRCDDTLGAHGGDDYYCRLSLRDLKSDVARFNAEFSGLLDPDLVMALENVPVRV